MLRISLLWHPSPVAIRTQVRVFRFHILSEQSCMQMHLCFEVCNAKRVSATKYWRSCKTLLAVRNKSGRSGWIAMSLIAPPCPIALCGILRSTQAAKCKMRTAANGAQVYSKGQLQGTCPEEGPLMAVENPNNSKLSSK